MFASDKTIAGWLTMHGYSFQKNVLLRKIPEVREDPGIALRLRYLVRLNGKPLAIEYNSQMHFNPQCPGGEAEYCLRFYRDNRKCQILEENNIPLLRIPYLQRDRIESLLSCFFESPDDYVTMHNPEITNEEYLALYPQTSMTPIVVMAGVLERADNLPRRKRGEPVFDHCGNQYKNLKFSTVLSILHCR